MDKSAFLALAFVLYFILFFLRNIIEFYTLPYIKIMIKLLEFKLTIFDNQCNSEPVPTFSCKVYAFYVKIWTKITILKVSSNQFPFKAANKCKDCYCHHFKIVWLQTSTVELLLVKAIVAQKCITNLSDFVVDLYSIN